MTVKTMVPFLALSAGIALLGSSCRTYNTYVQAPPPPPVKRTVTTKKPVRATTTTYKSATVSGSTSADSFQAVTKPSSYSN